jgi:hypothetical protein
MGSEGRIIGLGMSMIELILAVATNVDLTVNLMALDTSDLAVSILDEYIISATLLLCPIILKEFVVWYMLLAQIVPSHMLLCSTGCWSLLDSVELLELWWRPLGSAK